MMFSRVVRPKRDGVWAKNGSAGRLRLDPYEHCFGTIEIEACDPLLEDIIETRDAPPRPFGVLNFAVVPVAISRAITGLESVRLLESPRRPFLETLFRHRAGGRVIGAVSGHNFAL
jgi:hypothetical protein